MAVKYFVLEVQFIFILAWYLLVASMVSGSGSLQCSCYTFRANVSDWDVSSKICKSNGGDLVSIETLSEWEFITTQLKARKTSSGQDQWWIGLVRENRVWQWVNGYNLTYDKWSPGLQIYKDQKKHAIMEKNGGIFWNVYWYQEMGNVCEYSGSVCNGIQVKWCYNMTTTSRPTTILRDTTTIQDVTPSLITLEPTATSTMTVTTNSSAEDSDERTSRITDKPFPVLIVIIILVILLVGIGIVIIVCIYRKKREKHKDNQEYHAEAAVEQEKEQFLLKPFYGEDHEENSSLAKPYIYATVDKSKKTKQVANEPHYAEVNNSEKTNQDQPEELNYAELTNFTTDDLQPITKPPPYQPTEYATVNV